MWTSYHLRVVESVYDDAEEAATWLAENIAAYLALEWDETVAAATRDLTFFPHAHRTIEPHGARFISLKPFQYGMWFDILEEEVLVLAITHWAMDPQTVEAKIAQARSRA